MDEFSSINVPCSQEFSGVLRFWVVVFSFSFVSFFCLFILFRLLCLGWPFCMLEVCGSSLLWRFLPVGGVGRVAFLGFLVREACVDVLVCGAGSLLSGVQ